MSFVKIFDEFKKKYPKGTLKLTFDSPSTGYIAFTERSLLHFVYANFDSIPTFLAILEERMEIKITMGDLII
jgi:uncharacterized protein YpmS